MIKKLLLKMIKANNLNTYLVAEIIPSLFNIAKLKFIHIPISISTKYAHAKTR